MANKKISELSSAGALTGTESVEIVQGGANVKTTTQDIADLGGGGGGGGTWGSITGTLSSQTDLQAALNAKLNAIATIVDGGTNYTLQASDLTLINAGATVIIEGDETGTLTIPLDATVDFPDNCIIGFRGFILVAVTGGITETHTNDSLDCDPELEFTWYLEKRATNTWNINNGTAGTGGALDDDLQDIADLTPSNDDIIQRKSGVWTNRTMSQLKTDLQIPWEVQVACSDETTALSAGTAKVTFRMPRAMTVTGVRASLTTAQTSGSIFTVDINEGGTSILSTKLTIDNGEDTSVTAATAAVISDISLADNAKMTIDIDQIGDGTAKGLKVTILGY